MEHAVDEADLLRATPEYRAAWEVELWKRREEARFQKRLADALQKATDARLERIREREHALEEEYRIKQRELAKMEEKRLREQAEFRDKRQLLDECENVLRRRKEELEKEYTLRLRECEDKLRRSKEDTAHKVNMEQIKQRQLAASNDELKQRVAELEAKHRELWEDIARSKQGELKRHPIDAINAAVDLAEERARDTLEAKQREWKLKEEALQKKVSHLTTVNAKLKASTEKLTLKLKQSKSKAAHVTHVANELAADNVMLVRTGGQVPMSSIGQAELETEGPSPSPIDPSLSVHLPQLLSSVNVASLHHAQRAAVDEIVRLGAERKRLLDTGCYTAASPVVTALVQQQEMLMNALL
eukprot:TRINITY_DN12725_c0_g1_i1.p1 TRINITY_DN12725_c0_g1~~TRINITY_DN12725_c0_g1_i1.p1  ORF type:complete len:376 (+),score=146.37 TRINITY_DN12725_c0_g1_i1:56-1129(+)